MSFGDSIPFSESIGVFVGVSGLDWLTQGQSEPLKAVALSVAAGLAVQATRHLLSKLRQARRH